MNRWIICGSQWVAESAVFDLELVGKHPLACELYH